MIFFLLFSGFYCYGPMPDLTANNLVAVKPYANISGNARYHCLDPDNTKVEFHWRGHLDVKCLTGNTYEMPDPVPSCISEVVCTDTPGKAKNLYPKFAPSRARNMCKIFCLVLSKRPFTREKLDKLDQQDTKKTSFLFCFFIFMNR